MVHDLATEYPFVAFLQYLPIHVRHGHCEAIQAIVKSYRLYREHAQLHGDEPLLSLTCAWTLVRFFDSNMLQMTACKLADSDFAGLAA